MCSDSERTGALLARGNLPRAAPATSGGCAARCRHRSGQVPHHGGDGGRRCVCGGGTELLRSTFCGQAAPGLTHPQTNTGKIATFWDRNAIRGSTFRCRPDMSVWRQVLRGLRGIRIVAVDAGYVHWVALASNGDVYTCNTGLDGYAGHLKTTIDNNGVRVFNSERELGRRVDPKNVHGKSANAMLPGTKSRCVILSCMDTRFSFEYFPCQKSRQAEQCQGRGCGRRPVFHARRDAGRVRAVLGLLAGAGGRSLPTRPRGGAGPWHARWAHCQGGGRGICSSCGHRVWSGEVCLGWICLVFAHNSQS